MLGAPAPHKKLWIAYLWWLFLGLFGAHRFYLRHFRSGALYAVTLGCCGLGFLADLFLLPRLTREARAGWGLDAAHDGFDQYPDYTLPPPRVPGPYQAVPGQPQGHVKYDYY
jgi:TM2 domain-containing membrane protein YozV